MSPLAALGCRIGHSALQASAASCRTQHYQVLHVNYTKGVGEMKEDRELLRGLLGRNEAELASLSGNTKTTSTALMEGWVKSK